MVRMETCRQSDISEKPTSTDFYKRLHFCPTTGRIQISASTYALLMESGLSTPYEWQATGGVEVKGKGTMDTFLFLPDAAAAAPPRKGSAEAILGMQQGMQNLSAFGSQISEQLFRLMEAFHSVSSSHAAASHTAGPCSSNGADDNDVGTGIGDRPFRSSQESPFSIVGEVMSALRAAQQQQQHSSTFGRLSPGPASSRSSLSVGERSSVTDRTGEAASLSSYWAAGTRGADGGRGNNGPSRVPSNPQWSPGVVVTTIGAGSSAAATASSSSRGNVLHHSKGVGSGSLSSLLMEALGGTTAARRRSIPEAATAADLAAVRRRGSNAGALTCFPTDLR